MSSPCPDNQRNDLIIISPNGGLDVSPPCGCYEEMNISILDMIPFGKLMGKLGKFDFVTKYLLKVAKEANSKWIRAVQLLGGKISETAAQGASLIKQSRDEVLAYFKKQKKIDLDALCEGPYKADQQYLPADASFTNTLPDVTFSEVGAEPVNSFFGDGITIGNDATGSPFYNTSIIASRINAVKNATNNYVKVSVQWFDDLKKTQESWSKFINDSPLHDFPTMFDEDDVLDIPFESITGEQRIVTINLESLLPTYDISEELVLDYHKLKDLPDTFKAASTDPNDYAAMWPTIRAQIVDANSGVAPSEIDAIFEDLITEGGLQSNIFAVAGNTFNKLTQRASVAGEEFKKLAIDEYANYLPLEKEYSRSVSQLESIVRNAQQEQLKTMEVAAVKEANTSLTEKVAWAGQCFFHIFGRAINGVGRQKICLGDTLGFITGSDNGARLNYTTCNCECPFGQETCTADYTLNPVWGTAMWIWDNMIPVNISTAEMATCFPACCEGQVAYKSTISHSCGCACYGDLGLTQTALESGSADSHFKGASGCDCFSEGWMGFGKARGKCVSDSATTLALGQGQAWDDARCEYNCAETRHLPAKKGASPDCPIGGILNSYSALKENSVCECECAEPDGYVGTWPPTCPEGKIWDGAANICACVEMGTACFKSAVLYSTNDSGPGTSFAGCNSEEHGCCNFIEVVIDAGEECETTECWCPGEPDPVDDQGIVIGECGSFNTQHNVACRTDMSLETAQAAVGQRFVHNGVISYYLALHKYHVGISDCSTVERNGKTYFNSCECYFG